jgi:hypothetical protein
VPDSVKQALYREVVALAKRQLAARTNGSGGA